VARRQTEFWQGFGLRVALIPKLGGLTVPEKCAMRIFSGRGGLTETSSRID
jgi:hypothetical protein